MTVENASPTRDFTELDRQIDNAIAHAKARTAAERAALPGRDWDQAVWISGSNLDASGDPLPGADTCTAYGCLAGNTALDAGFVASSGGHILGAVPGTPAEARITEFRRRNNGALETEWGMSMHVDGEARRILGLTSEEAEALFHSMDSAEDLQELQRMLHAGDDISGYEPGEYR